MKKNLVFLISLSNVILARTAKLNAQVCDNIIIIEQMEGKRWIGICLGAIILSYTASKGGVFSDFGHS